MIRTIEVRNFKAIERGKVKLTPLTAFIGYNGMGKSSMLEGLQMFKSIIEEGLDAAIRPWREFEHIYYKGEKTKRYFLKDGIKQLFAPMEFLFDVNLETTNPLNPSKFSTSIGQENTSAGNIYFIEEKVSYKQFERSRDADNNCITEGKKVVWQAPDKSMLSAELEIRRFVESWQFLSMNTFLMGEPYPQKKTGGAITLNKDGRNIAEYLLAIRYKNVNVYNGILETMQYVLPYTKDLQPQITSELEKMVYLQLTEQDFKLPGWMLSTGTLKILALLAVFRNPVPSPLIVIEEIENGLDPRTINLIISEIREFVKGKKSQVIVTTHSPYLLDLLHLSQVVFVERVNENVVFKRPFDDVELRKWSKDYTPGELYEKDLLQQYLNK
jgi:predicted ATPase